MNTRNILTLIWLAMLGVILSFSSPAFAEGDPLITQASDQLRQALNPGGDQPGNADRTTLLKSALELLQKSPAAYHGQRKRAIQDLKAALFELDRGDPDHKVTDYIRDAWNLIRDIT